MPRSEPSSARERQRRSAARAAQGGSASWIQDHLDAVYRYARRRLNHADAEDVAQQAFEALFRAEAEGRPADDPGAYLLGTARRRVADVFRRRAQRPEPVPLPEGWEGYGHQALPADVLESAELRDLVHTALGLLRGVDADLLLDRYRRGASVATMAARLAASEKAVEMRLRRARQAFSERFLIVGRDWTDTTDDRPAAGPSTGPSRGEGASA